jgi:hypothetical protein
MFLMLFLGNTVLFTLNPSVAAAGPLYFKWKTYLGARAGTYIAPLAADVTGDGTMEIIVTGGTMDYGTDGTVSALDGSTGKIIWQVSPGGIGMHTPFEVADINNDGIQEIIIGAQGGALTLYGDDGSIYWRNRNAPAEENYPAVADVNNDGYDEIFVCRGYGPINGVDYITELSYSGAIIAETPNWHPCWGGLTIGDAYSNGTYILYQGDRSYDYNPSGDNYKQGGWGLRALDALTLTPLWNDSDILCSSHVPMLADVDKNGHLEVIAAWQSSDGLVVKDALTGAVDTTGGEYRKNESLGLPSHSQPTVGDLDGNGDMDIMLCEASNPIIWDLYTWKEAATLPIVCQEPPKVGNVTGSKLGMDIIAVTGSTTYTTIFSYDSHSQQFVPVQNITISDDLPSGTLHANAFSLVQDVDGDGYNELVLTSSDGWVYCFDAIGKTTPPARTGCQFYSERKCGVAEYVPRLGLPALTVTTPNGGQSWRAGTTHTITWTSSGNPGTHVKIELMKGGTLKTVISSRTADDSSYSWSIPSKQTAGTDYKIRITSTSSTLITDSSDRNFAITTRSKKTPIEKVSSNISISATPPTINIRQNTVISGSITPERPGANVTIQAGNILTTVTTDENSQYQYDWTPAQTGTYKVNASWDGDDYTLPSDASTTLMCLKIGTTISVSTSCPSTLIGYTVNVTGTLGDEYGNSLKNETVILSYTSAGTGTWNLVTSATTDNSGYYSAVWASPETGDFEIRTEWSGNATHSEANNTATLSSLACNDQYIFSVMSNSTISGLTFNAIDWALSFSASGPNGTTGYVRVTTAKTLVPNPEDIRVYLDGNQTEFSIISVDDSWLLEFEYTHSSHEVKLDFGVTTIPEYSAMLVLLLFSIVTMVVALSKRRRSTRFLKAEQKTARDNTK